MIASLGRADDEKTKRKLEKMAETLIKATEKYSLFDLAENLKAESSKEYGSFLVFQRLFKDLGLKNILTKHLALIETNFDITEALFNLILNRLTAPPSKRQMTLWGQDVEGPDKFDLNFFTGSNRSIGCYPVTDRRMNSFFNVLLAL